MGSGGTSGCAVGFTSEHPRASDRNNKALTAGLLALSLAFVSAALRKIVEPSFLKQGVYLN
jgi:hypothetical protein